MSKPYIVVGGKRHPIVHGIKLGKSAKFLDGYVKITAESIDAADKEHTHSQYITNITSKMITDALGYTPSENVEVIDNLESTSTDSALSAKQGKALKDLVDAKQPKGDYASTSHTHDERYYTETEVDRKLSAKSNTGHTHAWNTITGKPDTFNPSSHKHTSDDIESLDAAKITGKINIENLPAGALERCVNVTDDTARFALTANDIQLGDTVKVKSTGLMYLVINIGELSSEAGYEPYVASSASSVPWSGVTGKPLEFTPSSHNHDDRYYTETEVDNKLGTKANANHSHSQYLTSINSKMVTDALGYTPPTTDTNTWRPQPDWNATSGDSVIKNKPTSMPASDVYAWAKASSKPSYSWSEIGNKPSTFAPSSHTHNYAGSSYSGGPATKANGIAVCDSRDENPVPSSNAFNKNMMTVDFKINSKINSPTGFSGTFCGVLSLAPWNETSGGHGYQLAFGYADAGHPRLALRGSDLSATSWDSWYKVYTSDDKPTLSELGAAAASHTHTKSEVGLGNVNNTADSEKSVKYADSAGSVAWSNVSGRPSSLPANGGTAAYANYVYATSHQGSWYQNSQWDGRYFQTNYKYGNDVLPMKVNNAGYADSAGSVAWSNVSDRPSSLPANGGTATTISQKVDAAGLSHTNWSNNGTYVPTMNFLSYWDGAYNSNHNSNISYCSKGAFGSIVTKNAGDYSASNHSHTKSQIGLGNVDNTADLDKNVKSVQDYNAPTSNPIYIGYSGAGLGASEILHMAGYASLDGAIKIKDVSKENLRKWLDYAHKLQDADSMYGIYYGNDAASEVGGGLNNLVCSSWQGVSFTTNCTGQKYYNKTAVSIDCRNGRLTAETIGTSGGMECSEMTVKTAKKGISLKNGYTYPARIYVDDKTLKIMSIGTSSGISSGWGAGLAISTCSGGIYPIYNYMGDSVKSYPGVNLGSPSAKFGTIYSESTNSDKKLKKDIENLKETDLMNKYLDMFNKIDFVKFRWKNNQNSGLETPASSRYHYGIIAQEIEKLLNDEGIGTYDNGIIKSAFFAENTSGAFVTGGYQPRFENKDNGITYDYSENVYNFKHGNDYKVYNEIVEKDLSEINATNVYIDRNNISYIMIEDNSKLAEGNSRPPVTLKGIVLIDKNGNKKKLTMDYNKCVSYYEWDDNDFSNPKTSGVLNSDGSITISFNKKYSTYMIKVDNFNFFDYEKIILDVDYVGEYKVYLIPEATTKHVNANVWDRGRVDDIMLIYNVNYQELQIMCLFAAQQKIKQQESEISVLKAEIQEIKELLGNA